MPLPWKKSRVSRISRIVADLQSPKSGNSLVVETGFPTSLVDLFVKNRDKFKKPFKSHEQRKKKKNKHQLDEVELKEEEEEEEEKLVISEPIALSSSRDLAAFSAALPFYLEPRGPSFPGCELVSEDQNHNLHNNISNGNQGVHVNNGLDDENENEKRVLAAVLKIFVVVVLALSTKRLAVGITISAFFLILLEYVGKHVLPFLKLCSNVRLVLHPLIQRVLGLFPFRRGVLVSKQVQCPVGSTQGLIVQEEEEDEEEREEEEEDDHASLSDSCRLLDTLEFNSRVVEIQVVESNPNMLVQVDMNRRMETIVDLLHGDNSLDCLEVETNMRIVEVDEDTSGVLICKKEHSRRAKIKAKIIKKLVPKKLCIGKKLKKSKEIEPDLSSETSSCCGDDKSVKSEVPEEQDGTDQHDLEDGGKPCLSQLREEEEEEEEEEGGKERGKGKEEFDHGISSSRTGIQAKAKVEMIVVEKVIEERVAIERKGNSSCLIVFIIVLAGLLKGRFVAVALTIALFFTLKLVGRHRRSVNEPVKRSFASISS